MSGVNSRALMGAIAHIESYGVDPIAIADAVGLDSLALSQFDLPVGPLAINDFFEESARACEDRFFGLKLGRAQSMGVIFGPVWPQIDCAETIGDFLQRIDSFLEQHTASLLSLIHEDAAGMTVCYEVRMERGAGEGGHASRIQVVELGLAVLCDELKRRLGASWRPETVQFRHSRPDNIRPLQQVFGEGLRFNQDVNALRIRRSDTLRPAGALLDLQQNKELKIEATLDKSMPFVLQVERVIRQLLNAGSVSVEQVASVMNLRPRTMQYRLKQQDSNYQQLLDLARIDLALMYLNDSDFSVLEISERLGFTDIAAFSRFFKKQLHMSPSAYRGRNKRS